MRIGVDLGGTKIEAILLDPHGRALARERVATPRGDYPATLDAIRALVAGIEARHAVRATVGVGIPGAISRATGRVKNGNSTWLNGRGFVADLEAALAREVRVENDANCFAISEAVDGAGSGFESVFGVILGTGVGGGMVLRRRVIVGANAIAGEWGHNPLPAPRDGERPGPACWCGRSGCVETWLNGAALARDAGREDADAAAVLAGARAGEPGCADAIARYAERLARALATVINLFDPDAIVLGGGLSHIDALYDEVPRLWVPHVFSDAIATRLVRNRHGDSSGVRGAAWLWD
ncbi:MAG TPA: ROK family protein [Burkholderiaceae bacterium]